MTKKLLMAILLYGIVVTILFFPALHAGPDTLLFGDDIHRYYYFIREYWVSSLKNGIFPWWNPYQFSGVPMMANPQILPLYPFFILHILLPLPFSFTVFFILHILIGMVGMYAFLRRNLDGVSSFIGGILFGLSGFFMARLWAGHVGVIASASWAPWIAFFWLTCVEKRRLKFFILMSCAAAMQLLAGYQSMAIYTFEILLVLAGLLSFKKRSFAPLLILTVGGIFGIGLSAFQLLPAIQFMSLSIRTIPLPLEWATFGTSTLESLKMLAAPYPLGNVQTYHGPPPNYIEHAAFIGRTGLVLMGLSLLLFFLKPIISRIEVLRKSIRYPKDYSFFVVSFLLVAFLGIGLSLSTNLFVPLYTLLWKIVPFYNKLRIPSRHLFLFVFAGSSLSAYTVSVFSKKGIRIIIGLFVCLELILFSREFIKPQPLPQTLHDMELISYLQKETDLVRILPDFGCWIPPRDSLNFNAYSMYGLFSTTGYDPMILRSYYEYIDASNGKTGSSILRLDVQVPHLEYFSPAINFLNAKYVFVPSVYPVFGSQYRMVMENEGRGYQLYENTTALPRFFFVPKATVVSSYAQAADLIRKRSIDLGKSVIVQKEGLSGTENDPACPPGADGNVTVTSYTPNRITLSVSTPCNSFLVSSEVMYPGWTAFVDGKKTPILTGNMAFRTLYVPKGEHTVTYVFTPWIFYKGCAITIITIGIILLWFIRKRKGKKT